MTLYTLYTENTDGSTIEYKETELVWSYEYSDPDFGMFLVETVKELIDHLESVLANEPATIIMGAKLCCGQTAGTV